LATLRHSVAAGVGDRVDFLDDAAYQPQRLNIYRALTMTLRYSARWLLKFQYRAWGWRGLVKVHTWTRWFNWMGRSMLTSMLALRHDLMMKRGAKGPSASERFDMEFETYRPPVMSSKPPEKRAGPKKDAAA
jgi:hypothetical protein